MPTNHVTNLELSRRLKELGVPQKSVFYWATDETVLHLPLMPNQYVDCSAYLASELGEMLPKQFMYSTEVLYLQQIMAGQYVVFYGNHNGRAYIRWPEDEENAEQISTFADTEADARAKMLIYLIENHLISVEELGK